MYLFDACMRPLERRVLARVRARLLAHAAGRVLEVGAGTGANLPYYLANRITSLTLTDHRDGGELWKRRARPLTRRGIGFSTHAADVRDLPFEAGEFDVVVGTLLFCSVEDGVRGFQEIRRVLAPGGVYLFIEHVRPATPAWSSVFRAVAPAWAQVAGGCRLDRDTLTTMRRAGLQPRLMYRDQRGVFVAGIARVE